MPIRYSEVVPWGRNFYEYCLMFALSEEDLHKKILGCGDGPASFNSEANDRGLAVTSIDPVYALTRDEIAQRIEETAADVLEQTRANQDRFIWHNFKTVDDLGKARMRAMQTFLTDYETGIKQGRYVRGEMPVLDFPDKSFDLTLSSHFLFLYSDHLDYEFHEASIREMMRLADEARIFPLVDVNADRSPYPEKLMRELGEFSFEIRKTDYEFQKGGNEMMVISERKDTD